MSYHVQISQHYVLSVGQKKLDIPHNSRFRMCQHFTSKISHAWCFGNDRKNHETIYFWYENKLHFKRNMEKINWLSFACMVWKCLPIWNWSVKIIFLAMKFSIYIQHFQTSFILTFIWSIFFVYIYQNIYVFSEWI